MVIQIEISPPRASADRRPGMPGLTLPQILRMECCKTARRRHLRTASFGKAKNCIALLFLSGGPPQHETFDPSRTRPSNPGVANPCNRSAGNSCERDAATHGPDHGPAGGDPLNDDGDQRPFHQRRLHAYGLRTDDKGQSVPPSTSDWPSIAAAVGALRPSEHSPCSGWCCPERMRTTAMSCGPGRMEASWARRGVLS